MSVEDTLAEIRAALADMAAAHEGLRDYSRLNIVPETQARVTEAVSRYDRRTTLLKKADAALSDLANDGYPALESFKVDASVIADLRENAQTIQAALQRFEDVTVVSLDMQAGAPQAK